MPSNTASMRTDRLTCLRLEPMARIRPISRVRWATSIEKVLTIRKMPTRRAIPAKPSIAYFMTSRNEPTSSRPASAASFGRLQLVGGVERVGDVRLELLVADAGRGRDRRCW